MKKFLAVLNARNKEFVRDRTSLAWSLLFPILIVFGFSYTFSRGSQDIFKVGVFSPQAQTPSAVVKAFQATQYIQFVEQPDLNEALKKLKRHQVDMVISDTSPVEKTPQYWINTTSPKGYLLEKILVGVDQGPVHFEKKSVEGQEIRYVDWLISGLLGMNMMFSALFGIGYNIVRYRKNGVLKRLRATPLSAFEFLTAQACSRLLLIFVVTSIIYWGSHIFIHFRMLGSYFDLFVVMALGAICLISLSLTIAARVASEELAEGLLNLMSWLMMFLSGVWFSLEGAHPSVKAAAQIFPLTHVIDASRAIMTEGATLFDVRNHLIVLTCMSVVFLTFGSATFKWK